jgi:hypothetical protein
MSNVAINIAAEFTGKKAFKQAETSTDRLTKSTKQLAKGLLAVYSAQKVMAFAKSSVKAFAEDDKAAKALGTTIKNLGLAYGSNAATVNGFISRLEMQTGVLDDELRPAMDRLLRATGDVTKSQELLGLALDISAGTGRSLTQVSQSLQKAYLGQTQALGRLGVGLTKAELTSSSFEEIQARLSTLFAGQATAAADTYAGSLAKLTVANFTREAGEFIKITKSIFDFKNLSFFAPSGGLFGDGKGFGNISMSVSSQDTQRADAIAKKNAAALAKLTGVQAANQAKILKDKRLQAAIDKANLALNKSEEIFDMDKIQIAAALTNQAEQLGKATSSAQVMQIANDTARLNVKRSILALEDAIAAKDEQAIIAATNKLNADLKVLGALSGQNLKLQDIKSILDTLKPKDLINLANLDAAIAKMMELLKLQGTKTLTSTQGNTSLPSAVSTPSAISSPTAIAELMTGIGSNLKEFTILTNGIANSFQKIEDVGAFNALTNMYAGGAINPFNAGSFRMAEGGSTFSSGAVGSRDVNITVNAGVGDPEAIARAVEDVIRQSYQRGTSSTGLLTL